MRTVKHPERADRLLEFINYLGIKEIGFAKKLGYKNQQFLSQLLNKRATITADTIYLIGKVYPELNTNWLLEGEGDMLKGKNERSEAVSEPQMPYGGIEDPFDALKRMLKDHEERIKALENRQADEKES